MNHLVVVQAARGMLPAGCCLQDAACGMLHARFLYLLSEEPCVALECVLERTVWNKWHTHVFSLM